MTDRWVNLNLEVTIAAEDVDVEAPRNEKSDALTGAMDDLVDALESSGFYARYEPVLAGGWEDVVQTSPAHPRQRASSDEGESNDV